MKEVSTFLTFDTLLDRERFNTLLIDRWFRLDKENARSSEQSMHFVKDLFMTCSKTIKENKD